MRACVREAQGLVPRGLPEMRGRGVSRISTLRTVSLSCPYYSPVLMVLMLLSFSALPLFLF
jgi:hypothetical protein